VAHPTNRRPSERGVAFGRYVEAPGDPGVVEIAAAVAMSGRDAGSVESYWRG